MCQGVMAGQSTRCRKRAGVVAVVVLTAALVLTVLGFFLEKFNGFGRCLAALAPFEGVMRWGLVVGMVVYVIRIPDILEAVVGVLNRLKNLPGGVELNARFTRKDKEELAELFLVVLDNRKTRNPVPESATLDPPKTVAEVLDNQDWTRTMERWAIDLHLRRTKSIEFLQGGFDLPQMRTFDSLFKCGHDLLAVEALTFISPSKIQPKLEEVVRRYDGSREFGFSAFPQLSALHILMCFDTDANASAISDSLLNDVLGNRKDVRVFLYRFDKDNNQFKSVTEVK